MLKSMRDCWEDEIMMEAPNSRDLDYDFGVSLAYPRGYIEL